LALLCKAKTTINSTLLLRQEVAKNN